MNKYSLFSLTPAGRYLSKYFLRNGSLCQPVSQSTNFYKNFSFYLFVCFVFVCVCFACSYHFSLVLQTLFVREISVACVSKCVEREVRFSTIRIKQYVQENLVRSVYTHTTWTYLLYIYLTYLKYLLPVSTNLYCYLMSLQDQRTDNVFVRAQN